MLIRFITRTVSRLTSPRSFSTLINEEDVENDSTHCTIADSSTPLPLIIQTYGTTWSQQATFSFAFWPFSLKLLWAPVVDSLYLKRFGRRKSWLIPTQYLIGFVMIILSFYINDLLRTTDDSPRRFYFIFEIFN